MKRLPLFCAAVVLIASVSARGQSTAPSSEGVNSRASRSATAIPQNVLLKIIRAEDERRWDSGLSALLADKNAKVRGRAALAAGRIGDEGAVQPLSDMLLTARDDELRQMAAFALGEIESPGGAYALTEILKNPKGPARARSVEALGKITAALASNAPPLGDPAAASKAEDDRLPIFRAAILDALKFEAERRSGPDGMTVLLGLTAVLRAKPDGAGPVVAKFLGYSDPRIVADALNTMARLRLKENNEEVRQLLLKHADPVVRANAARVAGAAEDKSAIDALLDRSLHDADLRVRVSAIRSLGAMKEKRAAQIWLELAGMLPQPGDRSIVGLNFRGWEPVEALEIATALGRILQGTDQSEALKWLREQRRTVGKPAPELEIAFVRISPERYIADLGANEAGRRQAQRAILLNWKEAANLAQALGEIATMPGAVKEKLGASAEAILRAMLDYRNSGLTINTLVRVHSEYAIPDTLRALAAFKPKDLAAVLRKHLKESDVVIRGTAAELLGELPADETNVRELVAALPAAFADKDLNDAALAILDALGKQKTARANEAIKTALASSDHLLRRKAVALLKANGAGDFSLRIGIVKTRNTEADYRRAIGRTGKQVRATVETNKGSFTIEFLPEDAPLTVDNFIQLARKGFFNGQTIPRVVPHFVVQAGDPRGDQNGGPGYQIRCELNMVPYARAAVGMALSGKDTGGSQWFVTHSPQPHLDGGYTIFGRVVIGMEIVDKIARGDVIRRVTVSER